MREIIHTVRLTEPEYRVLKAAASARGTTLAEVIRGPALEAAQAMLEAATNARGGTERATQD